MGQHLKKTSLTLEECAQLVALVSSAISHKARQQNQSRCNTAASLSQSEEGTVESLVEPMPLFRNHDHDTNNNGTPDLAGPMPDQQSALQSVETQAVAGATEITRDDIRRETSPLTPPKPDTSNDDTFSGVSTSHIHHAEQSTHQEPVELTALVELVARAQQHYREQEELRHREQEAAQAMAQLHRTSEEEQEKTTRGEEHRRRSTRLASLSPPPEEDAKGRRKREGEEIEDARPAKRRRKSREETPGAMGETNRSNQNTASARSSLTPSSASTKRSAPSRSTPKRKRDAETSLGPGPKKQPRKKAAPASRKQLGLDFTRPGLLVFQIPSLHSHVASMAATSSRYDTQDPQIGSRPIDVTPFSGTGSAIEVPHTNPERTSPSREGLRTTVYPHTMEALSYLATHQQENPIEWLSRFLRTRSEMTEGPWIEGFHQFIQSENHLPTAQATKPPMSSNLQAPGEGALNTIAELIARPFAMEDAEDGKRITAYRNNPIDVHSSSREMLSAVQDPPVTITAAHANLSTYDPLALQRGILRAPASTLGEATPDAGTSVNSTPAADTPRVATPSPDTTVDKPMSSIGLLLSQSEHSMEDQLKPLPSPVHAHSSIDKPIIPGAPSPSVTQSAALPTPATLHTEESPPQLDGSAEWRPNQKLPTTCSPTTNVISTNAPSTSRILSETAADGDTDVGKASASASELHSHGHSVFNIDTHTNLDSPVTSPAPPPSTPDPLLDTAAPARSSVPLSEAITSKIPPSQSPTPDVMSPLPNSPPQSPATPDTSTNTPPPPASPPPAPTPAQARLHTTLDPPAQGPPAPTPPQVTPPPPPQPQTTSGQYTRHYSFADLMTGVGYEAPFTPTAPTIDRSNPATGTNVPATAARNHPVPSVPASPFATEDARAAALRRIDEQIAADERRAEKVRKERPKESDERRREREEHEREDREGGRWGKQRMERMREEREGRSRRGRKPQ